MRMMSCLMHMDISDFISKEYTYAVVGASANEEKYGFKVTQDLKEGGYDVIPVNPKGGSLLGLRMAEGLGSVGRRVDVVVLVVPPSVAASVVREVVALGITKVWFQPGSESEAALAFCEEHGVACVHGLCIMLERS